MATLNVQDYGAKGDGSTDDYSAIQSTIDDASTGDTVYLPAGTYLTSRQVTYASDSHPSDGITIEGDGETTVLKSTAGASDNKTMFVTANDGAITNFTLQNLKLDGNGSNHSTPFQALELDGTGLDNSVTVSNCWVQNSAGNNIYLDMDNVVIEWCTIRGARNRHGIAGAAGDSCVIRHCLSEDNAVYGFDSGGVTNPLVEDCVFQNNGRGGSKIGDGYPRHTTYRRCRFAHNATVGLFSLHDTGTPNDIAVESCIAENNSRDGFRFNKVENWSIGTVLAQGNNTDFSPDAPGAGYGNVSFADSATIVKCTEVRAYDAENGRPGIRNDTGATVDIGTYHYDGNATSTDGSFNIGTTDHDTDRSKDDISAVPTASEVGAGNNTDTTNSSDTLSTKSAVIQTS